MILGLDHVAITIPVGAEDDARAFYSAVLGLMETEKPEPLRSRGGVWFMLPDGRQLHLQARDGAVALKEPHPAFLADLDSLSKAAGQAGYEPRWDEALAPRRRFYLFDPFGNRLEFIEPIR